MNLEEIFDFIESNWGIKPKKIRYIEEGALPTTGK